MIDQSQNQQPLSDDVLRTFLAHRPAIMGPPTAACSSWLLSNPLQSSRLETNVVFGVAQMSGGAVGPEPLSARIRAISFSQHLDIPVIEIVGAVGDAAFFSDRFLRGKAPEIALTEEGAVLLSWETASTGTALLFAGDGTVVYSKSDREASYSESGIEQSVKLPPPAEYKTRLAAAS